MYSLVWKNSGGIRFGVSEEAGLQKFKKSLAELEKLVGNDPANLLIKDV